MGSTSNDNGTFFELSNNNTVPVMLGTLSLPAGFTAIADSCSGQTIAVASACSFETDFTPTNAIAYTRQFWFLIPVPEAEASARLYRAAVRGVACGKPESVDVLGRLVNSQQFNSMSPQNGSASTVTITGFSALTGANPSVFSLPTAEDFCSRSFRRTYGNQWDNSGRTVLFSTWPSSRPQPEISARNLPSTIR